MRRPRPGSTWTPSRWARRGRYADYVHSRAWAKRRRWWIREHRDRTGTDPVCVVCRHPDVDLHHLDYADLGHETYNDLIPLCRPHHDRVHAAWDATPHLRRLGRRAGSLAIITAMRTGDTETQTGRIARGIRGRIAPSTGQPAPGSAVRWRQHRDPNAAAGVEHPGKSHRGRQASPQ